MMMRQNLKLYAASILIGASFVLGLSPTVSAVYDVINPKICDMAETNTGSPSPNCPTTDPKKNPLVGKDGILMKIGGFLAIAGGVAAVIVIIVSGISYMIAGGDAQKAATARNALVGALIGLFIIGISSLIVTFVIQRIK